MNGIETKRLVLRKLTLDDSESLFSILSDPATMQYYPAPYDRDRTVRWIEKSIASYDKNGFGLWAVVLKGSSEFIGQCGISIQNINGTRVPEIGYHISREFWNNGYATEATEECLKAGFNTFGLGELFIHTSVENVPSRRVAEKLGMSVRFEYDKEIPSFNTVMRHVVYSITDQEYKKLLIPKF